MLVLQLYNTTPVNRTAAVLLKKLYTTVQWCYNKHMNEQITITKCDCMHCQYSWFPRGESQPSRCARCKSTIWNKYKKHTTPPPPPTPRELLGHESLQIGQKCLIPWPSIEIKGKRERDFKRIRSITARISAFTRRSGHKFTKFGESAGLIVVRTA